MRKQLILIITLAIGAGFVFGALYSPGPVGAASKEMIQLQQDITRLVEGQRALESSIEQKHAVLKTLIEQTLDSNNKLSTAMASLKQSMQESQAGSGSRVDTLATQVQALVDNIEEVKSRISKLNQQAADTQSVLQNLDAKIGGGAPSAGVTGAGPGAVSRQLRVGAVLSTSEFWRLRQPLAPWRGNRMDDRQPQRVRRRATGAERAGCRWHALFRSLPWRGART